MSIESEYIEVKASIRKRKPDDKFCHVDLKWYDDGKQKATSRSTGISCLYGKNIKTAREIAENIRQNKEDELNKERNNLKSNGKLMFTDWMRRWLEWNKHNVQQSTYEGYKQAVENNIIPYFQEFNLALTEVKHYHIQKNLKVVGTLIQTNLTKNYLKHSFTHTT